MVSIKLLVLQFVFLDTMVKPRYDRTTYYQKSQKPYHI
ncbi:MAG TPA: palindromic element RPE4 domain-containing protein [Rickettsia endosymbiont of Diachasma alloeum]|nr:palindromic element RPE4 domain-containing protein [Rickettsia endosymbiont of Diachasma alloeum]